MMDKSANYMQQSCRNCRETFTSDEAELRFLKRVSPVIGGQVLQIPHPQLCPVCRMQRRFAYRNERFLSHRRCDLTGRDIISFYKPDSGYKVYDKDVWWSDMWDPLAAGQDMDFSRSFFDQFAILSGKVPRLGMVITLDEGSAYSAYCVNTKNCYMCCSCVVNEGSLYCYQANDSVSCVDCNNVSRSELCYECIHCFSLFGSAFCKDCESGSGLIFCEDCRGCTDCIGCKNLVNRKNCIFNREVSPQELAAQRGKVRSFSQQERFRQQFRTFAHSLPTRASHLIQCENCTGDHLRNCRNALDCFDAIDVEDGRYVCPIPRGLKDSRDCHYSPGSELVYDSMSGMRCQRARFVLHSWDNEEIVYCDECFSSKNLFGCIGLKHKQYCILNRQYAKEEYERLVPLIVQHMRKTDEWGEFFPIKNSPFPYNETIAQDDFPLSELSASQRGWRWQDQVHEMPQVERVIEANQLPDDVDDVPDDILRWAIRCEATKRPFKIIRQELEKYRLMRLPIPRFHPEERYRTRTALRNPRKLWNRQCAKCKQPITTSYAPERPEKVFCEECYLKEVY